MDTIADSASVEPLGFAMGVHTIAQSAPVDPLHFPQGAGIRE